MLCELVSAPPATRQVLLLERAQRLLMAAGRRHDATMDGTVPQRSAVILALRDSIESQLALAELFPPRHAFWSDYRRLMSDQIEAVRWELRARAAPAASLEASFVRRLGRKSVILKWAAPAICHLAHRPGDIGRLERLVGDLLVVLQLFDDVADAIEDERSGIPNAVVAAVVALRRATGDAPDAIVRTSAAMAVCHLLSRRIARLRNQAPPGSMLERWCDEFARRCKATEAANRTLRLIRGLHLMGSPAAARRGADLGRRGARR
jgi:hypothetical protein